MMPEILGVGAIALMCIALLAIATRGPASHVHAASSSTSNDQLDGTSAGPAFLVIDDAGSADCGDGGGGGDGGSCE